MADLNGFDANNVEPNAGFDPIPAGKYVAAITASAIKPTKNGKGEYLELEMEVLEGPFKGRKLRDRLTLKHTNTQTVEFAKGTLSAICRAVSVLRPRDSVELHNLPLVVSVAIKNREAPPHIGEPTNTIKGYAKRDTGVAPQRPMAAASGGTPPWKR
jgi:hypothetical protein